MRKTTAIIGALAILAGLTACASGTADANGCVPAISSGDASTVVTAPGKVGTAPKVDLPTPLHTKKTQRSLITAGKGAPLQEGDTAIVDATIVNATDGSVVQASQYGSTGDSIITIDKANKISEGLTCAAAGSRVAIVATPKDSGTGTKDSAVYVIDVRQTFPSRADGVAQVAQTGLPAVVSAPNGAPGITVPDAVAPTTLTIDVLNAGDGATVKTGQVLIAKYTALGWSDRKVFDSSWQNKAASVVQVGAPTLPAGLSTALAGQKVGSRVLVVIPPKLATVQDTSSGVAPPTGEALVYVVDLLGIVKQ